MKKFSRGQNIAKLIRKTCSFLGVERASVVRIQRIIMHKKAHHQQPSKNSPKYHWFLNIRVFHYKLSQNQLFSVYYRIIKIPSKLVAIHPYFIHIFPNPYMSHIRTIIVLTSTRDKRRLEFELFQFFFIKVFKSLVPFNVLNPIGSKP